MDLSISNFEKGGGDNEVISPKKTKALQCFLLGH